MATPENPIGKIDDIKPKVPFPAWQIDYANQYALVVTGHPVLNANSVYTVGDTVKLYYKKGSDVKVKTTITNDLDAIKVTKAEGTTYDSLTFTMPNEPVTIVNDGTGE